MSKIKNGGLDQYGAGPFEQQQFGTSGVEGVNVIMIALQFSRKYAVRIRITEVMLSNCLLSK